jgi:hypothetical protein
MKGVRQGYWQWRQFVTDRKRRLANNSLVIKKTAASREVVAHAFPATNAPLAVAAPPPLWSVQARAAASTRDSVA